VLDEVGRGTSTYDGMSIARAVAEELHDAIGARTLFATHFHELTRLAEQLPAARNYTLAVTEQGHQVLFMRRLVPGGADRSYGIQVARLAGLPDRVVTRASQILGELESERETETSREEWETSDDEPEPLEGDLGTPDVETGTWRVAEGGPPTLYAVEEATVWTVLQELYHLDIANMTPIQALVVLNELQSRLSQR